MIKRKGIILAGGLGTRLHPLTKIISKQLLPVYDKPMIYYPLSILMLSEIRDILIISTHADIPKYKLLLGDGSKWGLNLSYIVQPKPNGLAEAFILGEKFLGNSYSALVLGDNIFYGNGLVNLLKSANNKKNNATLFAYHVRDPERYGVVDFDQNNNVLSIEEKPKNPRSNYAVTGLYFYDDKVVDYAKSLQPSKRGELEITDLNKIYLKEKKLSLEIMSRGYLWLDTGTHKSLLEASQQIHSLEKRQGLKVSCPEEIAFKKSWITSDNLENLANSYKNEYGEYLKKILIEQS